jgi:hypothetical protein
MIRNARFTPGPPAVARVPGRNVLVLALTCTAAGCVSGGPNRGPDQPVGTLDQVLFTDQTNRLVGIGGEILVNRVLSGDDPRTPGNDPDGQVADPDGNGPIPPHLIQRLDVGDWLVGIGVTQRVECVDCLARPDRVRHLGRGPGRMGIAKSAARAFEVRTRERILEEYRYTFQPLSPEDFSAAVAQASGGAVTIPPASIPRGTMVVSFQDRTPGFTLASHQGSPGINWREATDGARHWNVGVARETDFWMASFPSDDIGMVALLPEGSRIGMIRFGLSLLEGGDGEYLPMKPVSCEGPNGPVNVDVCLSGTAVGTRGGGTAFPIGLSTEVRLQPAAGRSVRTARAGRPD